ncbi:hypothetical protein Hanom_Chr13g01220441 [Helianthus anomalus]
MYNLVSHGSHHFLFKVKPQHLHPLFKTTKNDTNWSKQFFFISRDSIPNGNHLPKNWNLKAASLATLTDTPATPERLAAFWALDSTVRTYYPKVKDSEEASSASYTMSSKYPHMYVLLNHHPSLLRFGMGDIKGIISPRSIMKELVAGQSQMETKGTTTRARARARAGAKRKKPF